MSSRRWCFTINNPSDDDCVSVLGLQPLSKYLVVGDEMGDSGTPHLQGFVVLTKQMRLAGMKKILARAHLEVARGTSKEASDYCKKEGKFEEFGELPLDDKGKSESNKADWDLYRRLAKEGKLEEIPSRVFVQYQASFKMLARDHAKAPDALSELVNEWWHGETGTGKSWTAFRDFPGAYRKSCNKWWCHYQDQEVVIIEEITPKHAVLSHHLKIWADHYPFIAEMKGGSRLIRPKKLVVCSNYTPEEIWGDEPKELLPILRRFKVVQFRSDLMTLATKVSAVSGIGFG